VSSASALSEIPSPSASVPLSGKTPVPPLLGSVGSVSFTSVLPVSNYTLLIEQQTIDFQCLNAVLLEDAPLDTNLPKMLIL